MSFNDFINTRDAAIEAFTENNVLLERVERHEFDSHDYRALLSNLYYQTLKGPLSFASAGVNCCIRERWREAGKYLLHHAEEECSHHEWVFNDAQHVGGLNYSPDTDPPPSVTATYVSFNSYIAAEFPLGRLAIASVLEGIAATIGPRYIPRLMRSVGLDQHCFSFFTSHTLTDVGHSVELERVVQRLKLDETDWHWMRFSAETAARLYKDIYKSAGSDYGNSDK